MKKNENVTQPVLLAPREKMILSDVAVSFLWRASGGTQGYQIHYDRNPAFTEGISKVIMNEAPTNPASYGFRDNISCVEADKYACFPESLLEHGEWFWRVRALASEGRFGPWSETGSFCVKETDRLMTIPYGFIPQDAGRRNLTLKSK